MAQQLTEKEVEGKYSYEVLDRFSMWVFCIYWDGDVRGSINIPKDHEHHIEIWKQMVKTANSLLQK